MSQTCKSKLCRYSAMRCACLLCRVLLSSISPAPWLWLALPRPHRHCLTSLFTRTMRRVCWISVHRQGNGGSGRSCPSWITRGPNSKASLKP